MGVPSEGFSYRDESGVMTEQSQVEVTAVYELPVPIWVSCGALGQTFRSGIGSLRFDVAMPKDEQPVGAAPEVKGASFPEQPDGEILAWTTEYAGFIPEDMQPATALRRIVITAVQAPVDPDKSWRGPDHQLGELVGYWFDQVRTWAEIYTGQDLDPDHRVYTATSVGAGLAFVAPPNDGALGVQLTTPRIQPVSAEDWRKILAAVRDGVEPPVEFLLHRDARAMLSRRFYRRAVIDAATAAEIVLFRSVKQQSASLPENQRNRLDERATLGKLISIAETSGLSFAVTFDELKELNRLRIAAVHLAQAPGYFETYALLDISNRFISDHA